MTGRRRTPLQRFESRHAGEHGQDVDEFRNVMRRRQDAEEKLKRHLEGERDGRAIDSAADDATDADSEDDPENPPATGF